MSAALVSYRSTYVFGRTGSKSSGFVPNVLRHSSCVQNPTHYVSGWSAMGLGFKKERASM